MVIGLIALFIVVILIDARSLMNTNKKKKSIFLYFSLISIGFTMSVLQVIDKAPPSPAVFIEKIVRSIFY